jgi:hypothetical protein
MKGNVDDVSLWKFKNCREESLTNNTIRQIRPRSFLVKRFTFTVHVFVQVPVISMKYKIAKLTMCETQIIIRKAITKPSVGHHRPPTNAKVGSGAMEE